RRQRASSSSLKPIHTDARHGAASSDDEPIDFAAHLSRVNSQDRAMFQSDSAHRARTLKPLHNRDTGDLSAEHALDEEDILEATRAYRDRIRALNRL
ncbi:MAG: hypothetical protein CMH57_03710, partial [Myxococcales bacterium]|nr:hypothetical protein [Myxococcales bacterium]